MEFTFNELVALLGAIHAQERFLESLQKEYGSNPAITDNLRDLATAKDKITGQPIKK